MSKLRSIIMRTISVLDADIRFAQRDRLLRMIMEARSELKESGYKPKRDYNPTTLHQKLASLSRERRERIEKLVDELLEADVEANVTAADGDVTADRSANRNTR